MRGESGRGNEAMGEWLTAGALSLSAIVKELGGIIGLLSSRSVQHAIFNECTPSLLHTQARGTQ